MQWTSWNDFWQMGGYGFYVWSAYGTTALLLLAEQVLLLRRNSARARRIQAMAGGSGVSR